MLELAFVALRQAWVGKGCKAARLKLASLPGLTRTSGHVPVDLKLLCRPTRSVISRKFKHISEVLNYHVASLRSCHGRTQTAPLGFSYKRVEH